ncbi:MAG TPA: Rad52/Rad22 family DNA repair protein [Blastocatellia bacterium]|nr:Rad52/Rad22 family DNA repair protein [Blastocatellia bacterium]
MRPKEAVADVGVDQIIKEQAKGIEGAEDKKAVQRDRRAQSLAAMGLVTREGSRYLVKTAAARGRHESFEVWRDENGRVHCSCAEFERLWADDPAFRCEHILAVKHSLAANNVERSQPEQTKVRSTFSDEDHEMNNETPSGGSSPPGLSEEAARAVQIETGAEPKLEASNPDRTGPAQSAQIVPLAFANILRTLRQPIDSRLIKTREGWTDRQGNTHWVEYIEWHTVADILDRVAPDWSHAVRNLTQIGDMVAVTAAITIDGVTREGVGTGPADSETGIKKAEHDALKRAAVKFGIARDLYRRESDVIEENNGISPSIARDPRPKTLGDLVTPKQLWMIRNLGREIGCNVEQECQSLMQCNLEEISKRAASSFIDYLKRLQQENQPEELRQAS